jgi:hypothetical protein
VGLTSEDWLQNATLQKLQAKKKDSEKDVFVSPVSHCSSQTNKREAERDIFVSPVSHCSSQTNKREAERDVFVSPVSQCSSQLTPDILKFHRGRTFGILYRIYDLHQMSKSLKHCSQ